jgi:transposase, IS5 family
MRQERTVQASIFDLFAGHEIGRELKAMSHWLDQHPLLVGLVAEDLRRHGVKETGRQGLPAESVLGCGLLKQHRQLSYEELAFHLEDSSSFRAFARLPVSWTPKKSVLHKTISAIRAQTWEAINRTVLASAREEKIEPGKVIRLDSTVTAALMHQPSDSSLLWDAVRVMARLLEEADTLAGGFVRVAWHDHRRAAKKRARAIKFTRGRPNRVQHYRELIKITRLTLAYLEQAATQLWQVPDPMMVALWQAELCHYRPLIERIIWQSERRVLCGEAVAAGEKIVSLFEPHADIIVKGSRDVEYGHKLNLTSGRSGLILDAVIEAGNPADSERFLPMLERHIDFYGEAPHQAAADGGYAQPLQPQPGKGPRRSRHGLPQESRPADRGHGQEPLGLSQAQQLPRRHRGGHLVPEARLWPRPLHLARARPLQGLRLVFRRGLQPRSLRPAQANLTAPTAAAQVTGLSPDRTLIRTFRRLLRHIHSNRQIKRTSPKIPLRLLNAELFLPRKQSFMDGH